MAKHLQQTRQIAKKARRRNYEELGTELYIAPGDAAARWVSEHGRPLGFWTKRQLQNFTNKLYKGALPLAPDLQVGVRGSSTLGRRVDPDTRKPTGSYYDIDFKEDASDLDLSLVSGGLLARAERKGIIVRDMPEGRWTRPLKKDDLEDLGLDQLLAELSDKMDGRDVNVMIYDNIEHLRARGTAMILEKGRTAR